MAGKWIVVGAYYDGLGVMGGKTYPGADSNASGVAALIAVANAVRRDCTDGIIFVAFDARSRDFAGARPPYKGVDEYVRDAGYAAQVDVVSGPNDPDGLVGADKTDFFHLELR